MTIPEEVEFFKKGDEVEAKPPVTGDIGIDDIEKPPFEEVGEVFAK